MTLEEFKLLGQEEQAEAVWEGIFQASRMEGNLRVALYDLGKFKVEVYYAPEQNKIVRLNAFIGTSFLWNNQE